MRTDICEECAYGKFLQRVTFKAVAYGPASLIVCFISHVDLRFLSADFIMILKGQSMFSASADKSLLTTPLLIICSCYHGIRDFRTPHGLYTDSLLAEEKVSILRKKIQIGQQNIFPENVDYVRLL